MDSNEDMEYLEHYGVLGMHWGIRRYQPYPKGHKGDGRFLGETKKRLAQAGRTVTRTAAGAGRVVTRTASRAGRAAVTKAKSAHQAYKEGAPEREAKRFERRVSNRKEKAYQHPERLSDEELAARISRLQQEKQFKELTDDVIHPGKKRIEQYQDRIVNRVIDKAVDKAIDSAFKVVDQKLEKPKKPSEAEILKERASIAESQAKIAKANADIANQRNRMEKSEKNKNKSNAESGSSNQNAEKTSSSSAEKSYTNSGTKETSSGSAEKSSTNSGTKATTTSSQTKSTSEMTRREFERAERDKIKAENVAAKATYQAQKSRERAEAKQYKESMKLNETSSSSWDNDESYEIAKTSYWSSNGRTSTRVAVPRAVTGLTTKSVSSLPDWTDAMEYGGRIVKNSSSVKLSSIGNVSTYTSKGTNYAKTYMKTDSGAEGYRKDARYNKGHRIDTKR